MIEHRSPERGGAREAGQFPRDMAGLVARVLERLASRANHGDIAREIARGIDQSQLPLHLDVVGELSPGHDCRNLPTGGSAVFMCAESQFGCPVSEFGLLCQTAFNQPCNPFACDPFYDCSSDPPYNCSGSMVFDCWEYTCASADHSDKYLCGLGLDFWCSTTYLCNTMDECDSGHLFTCDTAFQCQGMNFTCSSGKTGITTCGAPNPNYFTNGNPNPQNFNCGSILGTGDQFNCWSTFTCSAGAQFQCTSNTAFACVMLQFTCADNTQFLCPPPGFNCPVPPNSFGCPFTSGNYFCNTRGGWGCGVNQQDGTYGCAAGGLGQFQCVPSDGGTFLPYYCAPQNGGYTCTWQANGFWCTPLRGDYICAPNPDLGGYNCTPNPGGYTCTPSTGGYRCTNEPKYGQYICTPNNGGYACYPNSGGYICGSYYNGITYACSEADYNCDPVVLGYDCPEGYA
ncbi:MAG: hypothetical protein ACLQNE_41205 [Thermoguttaceae bacterium]